MPMEKSILEILCLFHMQQELAGCLEKPLIHNLNFRPD